METMEAIRIILLMVYGVILVAILFIMWRLNKDSKKDQQDNKFYTHCYYCKKRIIIEIPEESKSDRRKHGLYSCNECIPENSNLRNGIDEPELTDISGQLWNEEKKEA
jgi:hypothetical protein